ncbi:MAG: conjugal transfer protein TraG N-terminal domain-containing protein, partial [Parachlamydiaceae bacterium]
MSIYTYGDSEILFELFNAIAHVFNNPLLTILSLIVGFFTVVFAVAKLFFGANFEELIFKYAIQVFCIVALYFLVPTQTVRIEDVVTGRYHKVDNVPSCLAIVAQTSSTIGYSLTKAFEGIFHGPKDPTYNRTGMIFGSDAYIDSSKYKIKNGDLARNLKAIVKHCVVPDLWMGRYSISELQKTNDIWAFLKNRSSKNTNLVPIKKLDLQKHKNVFHEDDTPLMTCKEALDYLTPFFKQEVQYYAKADIISSLPLTLQVLRDLQAEKQSLTNEQIVGAATGVDEQFASQQLMISLLSNELNGKNFAVVKSKEHYLNNLFLSGQLGVKSLYYLRMVAQCLVYIIFIPVIPISFLMGGIKTLFSWFKLVIWIQLWPPLYACLHYVLYVLTKLSLNDLTSGGLNLFNLVELENTQMFVGGITSSFVVLIPTISYYILNGSLNSIVSAIGSPISSSTLSQASNGPSAELTNGNYSYGNTSMLQTSYANTTLMHQNAAPTLTQGYYQINEAGHTITYGSSSNDLYMDQKRSNLNPSISTDKSIVHSTQEAYQNSLNAAQSERNSFSESISDHSRSLYDLSNHIGNSTSFSEGFSSREAADYQASARSLLNECSTFGEAHNMNTKEAMSFIMSAKAGLGGSLSSFFSADVGLSKNTDTSTEEAYNSALSIANSQEFQENYQKVNDFAKNNHFGINDDEGRRLANSYSSSLDKMHSSQQSYESAFSRSEQLSENLSYLNSDSLHEKYTLDKQFAEWGSIKFSSPHAFLRFLDNSNESERSNLVNDFFTDFSLHHPNKLGVQGDYQEPNIYESFQKYSLDLPSVNHQEEFNELSTNLVSEANTIGLNRDAISSRGDALVESVNGINQASVDFAFKKEKLSFDRANIQKEHDREGNVVWSSKLWNGPSRHENI